MLARSSFQSSRKKDLSPIIKELKRREKNKGRKGWVEEGFGLENKNRGGWRSRGSIVKLNNPKNF